MHITPHVKKILDNYESDNPGTKANLARILMAGRLCGTGKMVILPMAKRIEHIVQCCFAGRRLAVFSGGGHSDADSLLSIIRGLAEGGASGSIIGRNTFQRPRAEALDPLAKIIAIFQG